MSLSSIADRLNLSESTVSRALNDYPDISTRTKELVRKVARELGYQPNIHAKRLASGKSENLGYVIDSNHGQLTESFHGELIAGMAEALSNFGWDLTVLAPKNSEDELRTFERIARTRHISGLVISRTHRVDERFGTLQKLDIPFIAHGRSSDSETSAWIDVDNEAAFFEMTQFLAGLGHQRIAHIGGPALYNFAFHRAAGWRRGLAEAGLLFSPGMQEISELSFEGGRAAMARLLALNSPPTAVCCVSDIVAIGAMKAIRDAGMHPGREISVVGYDGLKLGEWLDPPLTTMHQPLKSAGKKIAEAMIKIINGTSQPTDHQELFRASFVRRGTANPPVAYWP